MAFKPTWPENKANPYLHFQGLRHFFCPEVKDDHRLPLVCVSSFNEIKPFSGRFFAAFSPRWGAHRLTYIDNSYLERCGSKIFKTKQIFK